MSSDLLLSRLHLQDVLLPYWIEHAALFAEVSEAFFFIVPVHLYDGKGKIAVAVMRIIHRVYD